MIALTINHCDPNNPENRQNIWMHKLKALYPDSLNEKATI